MSFREQAKRKITVLLAGLSMVATVPVAAQPDAREVLASVRASQAAQEQSFTGRLRTSSSRAKIVVPFQLTMSGGTTTYRFDNPPESLILHLDGDDARLERRTGRQRAKGVEKSEFAEAVRGTDITYEDLSLHFLYWSNSRVLGQENIGTRNCWVVQAIPPRGGSQYDYVRLWVEKSGALMKAECYVDGKLVKRFEVRNVQRNPDGRGYLLKTMRIQRMDQQSKERSTTYLEVRPAS